MPAGVGSQVEVVSAKLSKYISGLFSGYGVGNQLAMLNTTVEATSVADVPSGTALQDVIRKKLFEFKAPRDMMLSISAVYTGVCGAIGDGNNNTYVRQVLVIAINGTDTYSAAGDTHSNSSTTEVDFTDELSLTENVTLRAGDVIIIYIVLQAYTDGYGVSGGAKLYHDPSGGKPVIFTLMLVEG